MTGPVVGPPVDVEGSVDGRVEGGDVRVGDGPAGGESSDDDATPGARKLGAKGELFLLPAIFLGMVEQ